MASNPLSRRTISPLCADGVVAVGMVLDCKRHLAPICFPPEEASASRHTLVIDTTKYTGCGACEAACQICDDLPEGTNYISIMPFLADHAGRTNEMRLPCHNAQEAPTRNVHLSSPDHNGPAGVCETCRLALNFAAYTCQACHVQDAVDTTHLERGMKLGGLHGLPSRRRRAAQRLADYESRVLHQDLRLIAVPHGMYERYGVRRNSLARQCAKEADSLTQMFRSRETASFAPSGEVIDSETTMRKQPSDGDTIE